MTYLLLQTFLLLLASYFLGAFVACLAKRTFFGSRAEVGELAFAPADADAPVRPPVVMPPQPVRVRPAHQPVAPRAIDPVQPKIEVLRRPEPRAAPAVLDPMRFERALIGPEFNEGVPRVAIVEVRPSVLPPVTDIYVPMPPEPPPPPPVEETFEEIPADEPVDSSPEPEPVSERTPEDEPRRGGLAARLRDATTAAAAGAVAAAKAAAAASIAMPGLGSTRRQPVEEKTVDESAIEAEQKHGFSNEDSATEAEAFVEDDTQNELEALEAEDVSDGDIETEPSYEPEVVVEPPPAAPSTPKPLPEPEPPVTLIEGGDDFQRIRAIDADIEQKLKARGIAYFEHIAGWSASDVRRLGQELDLQGRIEREQWIEQAQILAKGGETYYSRNRKAMLRTSEAADDAEDAAQGQSQQGAQPGQKSEAEAQSGVAAASQGRSVAEMAAAAAAAIAAASASVTRGLKPIEPISPLSKVDPKISIPARITDAIREKESATATVEISKEPAKPIAESDGPQDDLKRIRGIGVLIEKRLNAMGIRKYEQIANWTSGDIDRVSRMLEFRGRIERESWVEQARILASGGQTEFSRRVDRGEVDTSRES